MEDLGLMRDDGHKQQINELRDRGDSFDLRTDSSEVLGVALKSSRDSTKPVFVSVGHRWADDIYCLVRLLFYRDAKKIERGNILCRSSRLLPSCSLYRIDLKTATAVVLACCKYRIPEPTRQADMRTREYIRNRS